MFQLPAILAGIRFTADRGLSLSFHTQELTDQQKIDCSKYHQAFGWLLFRENEFDAGDVPDVDAPDDSKTPGQRLRGVLYRVFEQTGREKNEWPQWYVGEMCRITDHYKGKLTP